MDGTITRRPLRADARRNYDRILAAAQELFVAEGAGASLEEIARRAGVGSATLHRHFPSRGALLDAVFHDRVEALCARARERAAEYGPEEALLAWLRDFNTYAALSRGLVASLLQDDRPDRDGSCAALITDAADRLLRRAQEAGAMRPGIRTEDMLTLVSALSLTTEQGDVQQADRLLDIVINGLRTPRGDRAAASRRVV